MLFAGTQDGKLFVFAGHASVKYGFPMSPVVVEVVEVVVVVVEYVVVVVVLGAARQQYSKSPTGKSTGRGPFPVGNGYCTLPLESACLGQYGSGPCATSAELSFVALLG
jgi:hypothetical protein